MNNDLQPRLENRPFFENHIHCESWVDKALLLLEVNSPQGINERYLEKAKSDLEYAKTLLSQGIFPPQDEIDAKFRPLVRDIMENREKWGALGNLYAEIWNYLAMEMAKENQD